jgi:hypothetical protein
MEESVQFPLEKNCVKLGTVLIETVLSGDSLYLKLVSFLSSIPNTFR